MPPIASEQAPASKNAANADGPIEGTQYATQTLWGSTGGGFLNTRLAPDESQITPFNATDLKTAWTFTTQGDVSATPTVQDKALYVPDWGGELYRIDTDLDKSV